MRIRWGTFVSIGVLVVIIAGAVLAAVNSEGRDGSQQSSSLGTVAGGGSVQSSDGATVAADPAVAPEVARDEAGDATSATGLGGLPTPQLRAHVVKRATLELEVGRRKGRSTMHRVIDAVGLAGGFVESTDQSGGRSRLTVRIPADEFDATLDRMLELGRERGLQVQGQDVTGAITDLDARLRNLRAQETVLIDLMRRATTIGDSIAVQQQLSQNQEQIEQLDGQRRALADQTTFATLAVTITPTGVAASGGDSPATLSGAWHDAIDAAAAVTGGVLIVVGALLPILVLAGLGVLAWRLVQRHRRGRPVAPAAG
jgi:hypothetical protein